MKLNFNPLSHLILRVLFISTILLTWTGVHAKVSAQNCGVSREEYYALLSIYDINGGKNWTFNDNWRSNEPVSNWYGVTVEDGKVVAIDLSNNNVTGILSNQAKKLVWLRDLYLANNGLTKINNLPPNLINLVVSTNKLYSLPELPLKLKYLDASFNGISSLPTLPSSIRSLVLDGNKLTSLPKLPSKLSLLTASSNRLNQLSNLPDSLFSLEVSFNYLQRIPNLPAGLSSLSASNNRLTKLTELPDSIDFVNVASNKLTYLPAIPQKLVTTLVFDNFLDFEDLEPTIASFPTSVAYAPQGKINRPETKKVNTGSSVTLSVKVANSPNNRFVWYKNGVAITDTLTTPYYTISKAKTSDAGVYTAEITNTVVTGLTLTRQPITLKVASTSNTNSLETARVAVSKEAAETIASRVSVYPNPFKNTIRLQGEWAGEKVSVIITDIQGRVVFRAASHQAGQQIQLSDNLPVGVYLLQVTGARFQQTTRLLKQ